MGLADAPQGMQFCDAECWMSALRLSAVAGAGVPRPGKVRRRRLGRNFGQRGACGRADGRHNVRRGRRRGKLAGPHDFVHLLPVEGLVFEQRLGNQLQLVQVGRQDVLRGLVGVIDDALDLAVNLLRREFA